MKKWIAAFGLLAAMACSGGSQKAESFATVSVEDFATIIADPDVQRLDVRTLAEHGDLIPVRSVSLKDGSVDIGARGLALTGPAA